MIGIVASRIRQKHRTVSFPKGQPTLPDRFRGFPEIDRTHCQAGCRDCEGVCPTGAITGGGKGARIDLGRCLFCGDCQSACKQNAIRFTREYRLAARRREALLSEDNECRLAQELDKRMRRLLGRSLKLREVSAGGCNACEADCNVLTTVVFDLGRFGIQFVASPRHADGLLITGPVTKNMEVALRKTYDAVPDPKVVIAVGACAISGGPFIDSPQVLNGAGGVVPVDLYVPGCPPHPLTILDGLLRLLGRMGKEKGFPESQMRPNAS